MASGHKKIVRVASDSLISSTDMSDLFPSAELKYENEKTFYDDSQILRESVDSEFTKNTQRAFYKRSPLHRFERDGIPRNTSTLSFQKHPLDIHVSDTNSTSYSTQLMKWEQKSTNLFASEKNWITFVVLSLLSIAVSNIPYVSNISNGLAPGLFFATIQYIRSEEKQWRSINILQGIKFFWKIILIDVAYGMYASYKIGYYPMAVWSFFSFLFFENRNHHGTLWKGFNYTIYGIVEKVGILTVLMIVGWLLNVAGLIVFFAGVLVSMPVSVFMLAYAYHDLFGVPSSLSKKDQ